MNIEQEALRHIAAVSSINSIEDVSIWDAKAKDIAYRLHTFAKQLEDSSRDLLAQARHADEEHQKLGFLKKLTTKSQSGELNQQAQVHLNSIRGIHKAIDDLESWIEKTPDTRDEAKQMIAELKLLKKELTLQKKEIAQSAKDTRRKAASQNASVANQIWASSKSKQLQRMYIRVQKEKSLNSQLDEMSYIENQIIQVEKTLLWLEKIIS